MSEVLGSLKIFFGRLNERVPLTLKIVSLTIIIGLTLWVLMDHIQSSRLNKIFYVRLVEKLTDQAVDDRIHINRKIQSYHQSTELFVEQRPFSDYVEKQDWSAGDDIAIKYYSNSPPWFPEPSELRIFTQPRYAMLLDQWGKVREVYRFKKEQLPLFLLKPDKLMLLKSHEQSFITNFRGYPYLIASDSYTDRNGKTRAVLMLASPVDDEFLSSSIMTFRRGHVVAMLTPEKEPRILVSSKPMEVPAGTPLKDLKERYVVTGEETYDYGAAEYIIRIVSLISMSDVDALTESVIATGRMQRNIIAPIFIVTFALIMFLVARRINRLNTKMTEFARQSLGVKKIEIQKGDELSILEKRFQQLIEEIIESHELLKKQAEEKTRLIVDNAFDAIVTMDAHGVITTWNPQAEVIFGWTADKIIGKKAADTIIPAGYREKHENALERLRNTGGGKILNTQITMDALHSDGHEFPVEIAISQARSGDEVVFVTIIRDVSDRMRAEEQIKASLREKEMLLGEIHHRVKNNMQIISSLLKLQSMHTKDKKDIEMLKDSQNRIRSMALIHEKLYQSKDLEYIKFSSYISDLARSIFKSYRAPAGNISLNMDISDIELNIHTAIPCGLIINELLSNSLKYAFPAVAGSRSRTSLEHPSRQPAVDKGEIRISLHKSDDDEIDLTVSDNGIGMPEDMDFRNTDSLGLQLVTSLSENQLQGRVELDRTNGTEFRIRFREIKSEKRI